METVALITSGYVETDEGILLEELKYSTDIVPALH